MESDNFNYDELDNIEKGEEENGVEINEDINEQGSIQQKDGFQSTLPDEEKISKTKLKISIIRYKEIFGKYLLAYGDRLNIESLDAMTAEQLEDLLDEVKITVGCRSSASMVTNSYYTMTGIVEGLGPFVGLQLNSLQATIMNNNAIAETLQEISLEYEQLAYIPPMQRLLFQTGQHILALHQINKKNEQIKIFNNSEISQSLINEFNDI